MRQLAMCLFVWGESGVPKLAALRRLFSYSMGTQRPAALDQHTPHT